MAGLNPLPTEVVVAFRGEEFSYEVNDLTLFDLQSKLESDTGVEVQRQKLFGANGKLIKHEKDTKVFDLLPSIAKVKLVGTPKEDVEKVLNAHEKYNNKIRIKDDMKSRRRRKIQNHRKTLPEYRFENIQTLPGLPDEKKARDILTRLSEDIGFLAVLKKHKWKVGLLSEMYPEGYVGVSEVCVLGVNKNKGMEISLRIRTDDLKGFRKYLSIKEVLCHELAHMVHSEHDDNFYMLMRQIQREIIELDWTKQGGKTLGNNTEYYHPESEDDSDDNIINGGKFVLGGNGFHKNLPKRDRMRLAALKRMEASPQDSKSNANEEDMTESVQDIKNLTVSEAAQVTETLENSNQEDKMDVEEDVQAEPVFEEEGTSSHVKEAGQNNWVDHLPDPSNEDKIEISKSLELVCSRNNPDKAILALETMLKYIGNVIKKPENKKYRRINLQNKSFHTNVLKALSARQVMLVIGWVQNDVENTLEFPDNDEALSLLVHAKKEIENCVQLVGCLQ